MLKRCFLIISIMCLTGCANLNYMVGSPQKFTVESPATRFAQLEKVNFWEATGSVGIKLTNKPAELARMDWYQFNRAYRISLTSALDLYQISIHGTLGRVNLWKNGTRFSTAKTPEGLMENAVGWSLPVDALSLWIKGAPVQSKPYHAAYDKWGHITALSQQGWVISYTAYKVNKEFNTDLPHVIQMRRSDGSLSAKIVVRHWSSLTYRGQFPEVMP